MNYIRHLNAFFSYVKTDDRLTASHVSLYLALFQYWNFNRFQNPFPVYRYDIMGLCKIGSKNTYHKCIKELHQASYIIYHPSVLKYQPVKISMIRLDKQAQPNPEQLDLFASLPQKGGDLEGGASTDNDTQSSTDNGTQQVPILTDAGTDIDTSTVPNMGHLIKQTNSKQERNTPPQKIFEKNGKIQEGINRLGRVPKSVHIPAVKEVEDFFIQANHSQKEAKKFFNHYKAIGWKIQGVAPIEDWKALAEKWMTNAEKWDDKEPATTPPTDIQSELQFLYDEFLKGKKVYYSLTAAHYEYLKLELTEDVLEQTRQHRINQLTGSNQHSIIKLWEAYLNNDDTNKLIIQDKPAFTLLAQRIAVINHFHQIKNQST